MLYRFGSWGAFLWGIDTGTAVTTFRVSVATWAAFALAFLHVLPFWSGLIYGAAFFIPLVIVIALPVGSRNSAIYATGSIVRSLTQRGRLSGSAECFCLR